MHKKSISIKSRNGNPKCKSVGPDASIHEDEGEQAGLVFKAADYIPDQWVQDNDDEGLPQYNVSKVDVIDAIWEGRRSGLLAQCGCSCRDELWDWKRRGIQGRDGACGTSIDFKGVFHIEETVQSVADLALC